MNPSYLKATIVAAVFGLGVFALQSCSKLTNLLHFNLSMQTESVNFTIPLVTDTSGTFTVGQNTNAYNVDSFIRASTGNQLGEANITSVQLSSVVLVLNNATTSSNFQDFESCTASFYSNTNTTPYVLSISDNPDVYASSLSLPVDTSVNLASYLGNQFTYSFTGKLRHATTAPLNCTVTFTFSVKVQG